MSFFDPRGIERDPVVELLPSGVYICKIKSCVKKENNSGMGVMLFLSILNPGELEKKIVADYFNLDHMNEDAKRIGRQKFAKLLDCVGKGDKPLENESELHHCVVKVQLSQKAHHKNTGELQNNVDKYMPVSDVDLALAGLDVAPF